MKFTFTFSASHRLGRRCNRLFVAAATVQPFSASSGDLNLNQIHQRMAGRKRFYKQVGISPITVEEAAEGSSSTSSSSSSSSSSRSSYSDGGVKYLITLDGRTLKTPARNPFHIPNMELALAVAAEWDAQLDNLKGIEPTTMPMTQMMFTAIDQISVDKTPTMNTLLGYLPTDTALFFTTEDDRILLGQQRQKLEPILRWMKRTFQIELETSRGHFQGRLNHSEKSVERVQHILSQFDPLALAVVQSVTLECKSLVMALAFIFRHLTLEQAKSASRLEEEFQVEIWGVVEGGHDMDRLNNSISLASADTLLRCYWRDEEFKRIFSSCSNSHSSH